MKIYNKIVFSMNNWDVIEEESFDYDGPLDLCISGGRQKSKEYSHPVQVPLWNTEQENLWRNSLSPYLKKGMQGPPTSYPRQMFVPRTSEEESYFNSDVGYSPDFAAQLAKDLTSRKASMADSLNDPAFSINKEATDEFFRSSIKNPMLQEYREIVDPGIREAFAGPGYWGSARAQGQQQGAEHLATTLGSQYGQLQYADEQARRESLESAKAREAHFADTDVQSQVAAMQEQLGQERWGKEFAEEAGKNRAALSREIEQEKVMAGMQRWLMGEEVDGESAGQFNPYTQLVFQALGLAEFGYGQETTAKSSGWNMGVMSS